jgi:hypothetical protein
MSRTYHHGKYRQIRVRGVARRPTDLKRVARALIELEYQTAQSEIDAKAQRQMSKPNPRRKGTA